VAQVWDRQLFQAMHSHGHNSFHTNKISVTVAMKVRTQKCIASVYMYLVYNAETPLGFVNQEHR